MKFYGQIYYSDARTDRLMQVRKHGHWTADRGEQNTAYGVYFVGSGGLLKTNGNDNF